jgi:exonuclease III
VFFISFLVTSASFLASSVAVVEKYRPWYTITYPVLLGLLLACLACLASFLASSAAAVESRPWYRITYLEGIMQRKESITRFQMLLLQCYKFTISILLCLFLLLVLQGVERNPGPATNNAFHDKIISICTYNVQGLSIATYKGMQKFRKIINLCKNNTSSSNVICLQETHLIDLNYLRKVWQSEFVVSNGTRASRGVAILLGKDIKIINKLLCEDGRFAICKIKNESLQMNTFVANIYAPNNHNISQEFYRNLFDVFEKFIKDNSNETEEFDICITGDFNFVTSPSDCKNRNFTPAEAKLAEFVDDRMSLLELTDAKLLDKDPSLFTWQGRNIFSRLDRFYINQTLLNKTFKVSKQWGKECRSDHAMVCLEYLVKSEKRGPGILKLNQNLLKKKENVEIIKQELEKWTKMISPDWTPDKAWDFIKAGLHSIAYSMSRKEISIQAKHKKELQDKLTSLKLNLPNLLTQEEIETCNKNIFDTETELERIFEDEADKLVFISGLKWRENGEKSSKYFFGLAKKRQDESAVVMLRDEQDVPQTKLSKIMDIAKTFYQKLYELKTTVSVLPENDFFNLCPSLTNEARGLMEKDLTIQELLSTLKTCNESAPGPDGIPYLYYKTFHSVLLPRMLKAWQWSLASDSLCSSQTLSSIFLIPKKDKDKTQIKNWRPITLSNCDIKIITKAYAIRLNSVLDQIIHKSQSAYVPGRNIMDNIRTLNVCKQYAIKNNIDSVIVSLDAQKAFDSVDHKYLDCVLKKYGFGDQFRKIFSLLYKDNKSTLLINGFQTSPLPIQRGVKQGDALSCGLFIIALDPLIRNIDNNPEIDPIVLRSAKFNNTLIHKIFAYADDICIFTLNNMASIQAVFYEYERLTTLSGLQLNADKTEFLRAYNNLNLDANRQFDFKYNGIQYHVSACKHITICGIQFANDQQAEYEYNIVRRINAMENQLKRWICRDLTLNGRNMIAKTFGFSQLIYAMQCCSIKVEDITRIERLYFKFLWCKKWDSAAPDRIKRAILKSPKEEGGLNCVDVNSLDESIKLRQYFKSLNGLGIAKDLQIWLLNDAGVNDPYCQEFGKFSSFDEVTSIAMKGINKITKYYRQINYGKIENEMKTEMINQALNTNLRSFLRINNFLLAFNYINRLPGVKTLKDLINGLSPIQDSLYNTIFNMLPSCLKEIKEFARSISTRPFFSILLNDKVVDAMSVSTKIFQILMKKVNNSTEPLNVELKHCLNVLPIQPDQIFSKLYKTVKDPKLRAMRHRLLHGDIFCKERMYRFKMSESPECERCGEVETIKHQFYECDSAFNSWRHYNNILEEIGFGDCKVESYVDALLPSTYGNEVSETLKTIILKMHLQISRPLMVNKNMIVAAFKKQVGLEVALLLKIVPHKYHKSVWKKAQQYLNR